MKRIAVFRALYLGDMLLAVPALRALRQRFPRAEITLIGLPWSQSLVERYPGYLDRHVSFVGYPGIPEVEYHPRQTHRFLKEQRKYGYDLAIQMHGSGLTSNAFVRKLAAQKTIGYVPDDSRQSRKGLACSFVYPQAGHEIQRNLDLVGLLDCSTRDTSLEFPLCPQDMCEARRLLTRLHSHEHPLIALHPGAKYPSRRWPIEYFAQLADMLASRLHAQIIFTGSKGEQPLIEDVLKQIQAPTLNLAGQTSLGGLAGVLSCCNLFISNDTGPAHLAAALDIPSITLFGPAESERWAPLDWQRHLSVHIPVVCSPCTHQICPIDHRCLRGIRPMLVYDLAAELCARPASYQLPMQNRVPIG